MKKDSSVLAATLTAPVSKSRPLLRNTLSLRISERRALLIITDIVAIIAATLAALLVWSHLANGHFSVSFIFDHIYWFIILSATWVVVANANEYYKLNNAANLWRNLRMPIFIVMQLLFFYTLIFFFVPRDLLPRLFIVIFAVFAYVTSVTARLIRQFTMNWSGFQRRVVIVGAGQVAHMMVNALKIDAPREYEVVGCVTSFHDAASLPATINLIGFGADLPEIVHKYDISELVMAYINEVPEDIFEGLLDCYQYGVTISPMPKLYEEVTGRVPIEHVGERLWSLVLPLDVHTMKMRVNHIVKRIIDITLSLIGLTLFAPFYPLIALIIKLDSRGPILFYQNRVGQGSKIFTIVKFRSMLVDAEKRSGPLWASADDPRITRFGRFMRKTRIDEIPQLLNVLRGDMSIVGPRPERPEFVAMLTKEIPFYKSRLVVKPGLTGWAQIRYCYGSSVDDSLVKLQYDLYYIRNQSMILDLIIMSRTIAIMLKFQGT